MISLPVPQREYLELVTHRHKTSPTFLELSPLQQRALDAIVAGCRDSEVAKRVRVARETVTRWRLYDPVFRTALEDRRQELWTASADAMRALIPKAIAVIDRALESENERIRTTAAYRLLAIAGTHYLAPTVPDVDQCSEANPTDSFSLAHLSDDQLHQLDVILRPDANRYIRPIESNDVCSNSQH